MASCYYVGFISKYLYKYPNLNYACFGALHLISHANQAFTNFVLLCTSHS